MMEGFPVTTAWCILRLQENQRDRKKV